MIYGSICSGIEAASVAWVPLGWRPVFFSEIESFPRAVLQHRLPDVPLHGDFTTIKAGDYEPIDLLVGGTPCQDFSVAGLRAGMDGDRGNLTLQFLALARRLRPKWLVWENVPGVLSSGGGRDFGAFLGGLGELRYGWAYRTLNAQYFGVPQRRRRVFVVGYLGDWRPPAAVLFERHCLQGYPAPSREAWPHVAKSLRSSAGRSGGMTGDEQAQVVIGTLGGTSPGGGWRFGADEAASGQLVPVARGLTARYRKGTDSDCTDTLIVGTLNANGKAAGSATQQDAESGLLIAFDPTQITSTENRSNPQPGGPAPTLAKGARAPAIAFNWQASGKQTTLGTAEDLTGVLHACQVPAVCVTGEVAHTLKGAGFDASEDGTGRGQPIVAFSGRWRGDDGRGYDGPPATMDDQVGAIDTMKPWRVASASSVRRLTPRECERLQGFPDDWTLVPYRGKPAVDGPRYKALGNSMAVPCMRWIGERIQMVSDLLATLATEAAE